MFFFFFFFFNDTATTEIYTLSLHDALPISAGPGRTPPAGRTAGRRGCGRPPTRTAGAAWPAGGRPAPHAPGSRSWGSSSPRQPCSGLLRCVANSSLDVPGAYREPDRRRHPEGPLPELEPPPWYPGPDGERGGGPGATVVGCAGPGGPARRGVPGRDDPAHRRGRHAGAARARDRRHPARPGRAVGRVPVGQAGPGLGPRAGHGPQEPGPGADARRRPAPARRPPDPRPPRPGRLSDLSRAGPGSRWAGRPAPPGP